MITTNRGKDENVAGLEVTVGPNIGAEAETGAGEEAYIRV